MNTEARAILIVDDRPANLVALEHTLGATRSKIVKAMSGYQALAATLQDSFALAILDVKMPGMDGYELAELLRGNPDTRAIPIIFLTAASSAEWQIFKGYEAGAVDYIVKPYDATVLLAKVQVFLELHEQRAALERNQRQLSAINQELDAFAGSVSHDLRAPLRAIEGFSEALIEDHGALLDEEGQDYLQRIYQETKRMSGLVTDLLELARLSQCELRWQHVDISSVALKVINRAPECKEKYTFKVKTEMEAFGDPSLLEQALENLICNAIKFSKHRDKAVVEVGAFRDQNQLGFFVKDNGAGFDMNYADKIFAPFTRLHDSKEYSGTGVGLSTVQRIVNRHYGRLWCESSPQKGATFFFTLGTRPPSLG